MPLFNFQISGTVALQPVVSSFSPTDIAGLKLWLKADSLGLSNLGPVSTWADSSGNGNDATQGTLLSQPLYLSNVLNGKPVVRFDGADDKLAAPALTVGAEAGTIFLVQQATSTGQVGCTLSGNGRKIVVYAPVAGTLYFDWGPGDGSSGRVSGAFPDTAFHALTCQKAAATQGIWIDGVSLVSTGGTAGQGTDTSQTFVVGSDTTNGIFFGGDVAEVLIYDSDISPDNRKAVEDYLGAKYGLTITH